MFTNLLIIGIAILSYFFTPLMNDFLNHPIHFVDKDYHKNNTS